MPARKPVVRRVMLVSMLHGRILVEPAARLDVDRFADAEDFFEDVAVAVQPQNAFALVAVELVDEETRATEEHVGDAA